MTWERVAYRSNGCYCVSLNAHERSPIYEGGHCLQGTVETPWTRHGFHCSRGHSNSGYETNVEWQKRFAWLSLGRKVDIVTSAADLYLLEAITYDVANLRPTPVPDVANINLNQKPEDLLNLIGVRGPVTIQGWIEKYGQTANPAVTWANLYSKYASVLQQSDYYGKTPLSQSLASIKQEAHDLLDIGSTVLALILRDYMHYAACSEMTYHHMFVRGFDSDVSMTASTQGWMDYVDHAKPGQAAATASIMFRDKKPGGQKAWSAAYGGSKWAKATDVLSFFEAGTTGKKPFGPKLFADRMFSLEHNTGSILNKWQWGRGNAWQNGHYVDGMTPILDAHANSDYNRLHTVASDDVVGILKEYWTVTNREFIRAGLEPVMFPPPSPVYSYGSYAQKAKPQVLVTVGKPPESAKATVLIAVPGSTFKNIVIPTEVSQVGKKVVHKTS